MVWCRGPKAPATPEPRSGGGRPRLLGSEPGENHIFCKQPPSAPRGGYATDRHTITFQASANALTELRRPTADPTPYSLDAPTERRLWGPASCRLSGCLQCPKGARRSRALGGDCGREPLTPTLHFIAGVQAPGCPNRVRALALAGSRVRVCLYTGQHPVRAATHLVLKCASTLPQLGSLPSANALGRSLVLAHKYASRHTLAIPGRTIVFRPTGARALRASACDPPTPALVPRHKVVAP